jgi:hypothetical protein
MQKLDSCPAENASGSFRLVNRSRLIRVNGLPFTNPAQIDLPLSVRKVHDQVLESRIFPDIVNSVRMPRMNGLAKRAVHSSKRGKYLDIPIHHIRERHSIERALLVDRMHDRPRHGKQRIGTAKQIHIEEAPHRITLGRPLELECTNFDARLDDLILPDVG